MCTGTWYSARLGFVIRPLRSSNCVSSISASPIPMMIPPRNWLFAVLGLRSFRNQTSREAADAYLASDRVHSNFGKHSPKGMHRPMHYFERSNRSPLP